MSTALHAALAAGTLLVPTLFVGSWVQGAKGRLVEAEAAPAAEAVAVSSLSDVDYCTADLKKVLRRVLQRHVPASLTRGAKMGFAVPLGAWLRGPLRAWAEDLLDPRALRDVGVFAPAVVRARWQELLDGTRPWEHHLWDVLVYQAWARAQTAPRSGS